MREMLDELARQGFNEAELDLMTRETPARLLGIEG
jgi:predicted metal-dependent phosphotriesterase family hydrolase